MLDAWKNIRCCVLVLSNYKQWWLRVKVNFWFTSKYFNILKLFLLLNIFVYSRRFRKKLVRAKSIHRISRSYQCRQKVCFTIFILQSSSIYFLFSGIVKQMKSRRKVRESNSRCIFLFLFFMISIHSSSCF
jgi:hypothetical protein